MPKATFNLVNGTTIQIEGTTAEVQKLLELYGPQSRKISKPIGTKPSRVKKSKSKASQKVEGDGDQADLSEIVNLVKDCNEAESIEKNILDKTGQVNRTLLPLYIVHEYKENSFGLTSGEVSKVTTDLGIPISQPNASITLSGTASRYVMGDKVKKKGQAVRYKLSRRGTKYLKEVIRNG